LVHVPVHLRPIVAADALIFYLRKICWPGAMGVDYGRTPQAVLATNWLWPCIALLALVVIVLLLRRRFPVLLAAAAVFLVGLIPVLGLARFEFQHFSTVADHYLYVAMLGPALVGAWLAAKGGNGSAGWTLRTIVIATIFAMLIVRTETQIRVWRNGVTLFSHAVVVNPNSWMSWSNLGNALAPTRPQEAIEACERAAEINPDDANNWNSLGSILMSQGERSAAVDAFARAWKLAPENPMYSANYRRAAAAMR